MSPAPLLPLGLDWQLKRNYQKNGIVLFVDITQY